jgi:hypothetical protein
MKSRRLTLRLPRAPLLQNRNIQARAHAIHAAIPDRAAMPPGKFTAQLLKGRLLPVTVRPQGAVKAQGQEA